MRYRAEMDDEVAGFLDGVAHREFAARAREHRPGIAELAARLAVERGLVDDNRDLVAGFGLRYPLAALEDRQDHPLGGLGIIAEEFGRADFLAQREPRRAGRRLAGADPAFARLLALARHRLVEPGDGDLAAPAAQHDLGKAERKAVGGVEPERDLDGEILARREMRFLLVEQAQTPLQGLLEVGLLEPERLG